jgi:O-antigen ligase
LRKFFFLSGIILCACSASFFLLPSVAKNNIIYRIQNISEITTSQPLSGLTAGQGRGGIWKNAISSLQKNPLGYGLGYHEIADINGDGLPHRIAHNTLLQILLTGGIPLFLLSILGIYTVTRKVLTAPVSFSVRYYLFSGLIAVSVGGLFIDSLLTRWIWVMIALVILSSSSHLKTISTR